MLVFCNTNDSVLQSSRPSKTSYISVADSERVHKDNEEEEAAEYTGSNVLKYVALPVFSSLSFWSFLPLSSNTISPVLPNFIGASYHDKLHSIANHLLPRQDVGARSAYEKIAASIVVVVCFILGCYVTYTTGKVLFLSTKDDVEYPFCGPDFENTIYYNYTAVHDA
ncbi:unnamed protein product [Peronospora destructor]|uniref:Uncharacterized protein n=1 Tax=Peronospora destructor TaxID=86335 RepID=A0AAV0V0J2_9STRA|nr:unnamed protein product [Peronospora destructor]